MTDEMLKYILTSKATRQINAALEALRQTDVEWLILYAVLGLVICFFGYTFRRFLPFLIGLTLGFAVSCILNKLRVNGNEITIERLNSEISEFIAKVKAEGSGFLKTFADAYYFKSLAIPIICALVCACLGALMYKLTLSLCIGALVQSFASIMLYKSENVLLYSILIALGSFILFRAFYSIFFILLTAASGATCIGFIATAKEITEGDQSYILSGALLALGAACQFFLLIRNWKRRKKKRAAAKQISEQSRKGKSGQISHTAA